MYKKERIENVLRNERIKKKKTQSTEQKISHDRYVSWDVRRRIFLSILSYFDLRRMDKMKNRKDY